MRERASAARRSARAAATASRIAKKTAAPRKKGGSPTAFDECLDANSCLSGTTALRDAILADGDLEQMYSTPCRDGSFGPMCRVCQQGFGPNILGECSQCAGTAPGFILLALGSVMLGCFVFYLVWQQVVPRTLAVRIKRRRTMLKVRRPIDAQVLGVDLTMAACCATRRSLRSSSTTASLLVSESWYVAPVAQRFARRVRCPRLTRGVVVGMSRCHSGIGRC